MHACDRGSRHMSAAKPLSRRASVRQPFHTCAILLACMVAACGQEHPAAPQRAAQRSEEHTSELQSLMRISYAVFCLKKKNKKDNQDTQHHKTTHIHCNQHHKKT